MNCGLNLERPKALLNLGTSYSQVMQELNSIPINVVVEEKYFVIKSVKSLDRVTHDLGLHFSNQKLCKLELYFFNLEEIDTDDEFLYLKNQLIKFFGSPTTSALQENIFQQNQWIINDTYQVSLNQSERGATIEIQDYLGFKLLPNGFWIQQSET